MTKKDLTSYQQGAVARYYDNIDAIKLQRLQEIVTELYLAETEAKKKRLWEQAAKAMMQIKVPKGIMAHILEKRSAEVLAENINDWLRQAARK
jgi:hypothetical protein